MDKFWCTILLIIAVEGIPFTIYMIADRLVALHRLKENQKLWDEYSKGMTLEEKEDCYLEWCHRRKAEKGYKFYYFPRM